MFVIKSNNLRLNAKFNLLQLNKLLFAISKNVTFLGDFFFFLIVYFRKHTYSLLELHISITESEQITNTQIYKYTTYKVAKKNKWRIIN